MDTEVSIPVLLISPVDIQLVSRLATFIRNRSVATSALLSSGLMVIPGE